MSEEYRIFQSEDFSKTFRKKTRKNKVLKKTIISTIDKLRNNPYRSSERMEANHKGKRRIWAGKYRIMYSICQECVELGDQHYNNCHGCDGTGHPEGDVILQTLMPKKHEYKR